MTQSTFSVGSLAELASVHVSELDPGARIWVDDVQESYYLLPSSSLPVDGVTVVAPAPGASPGKPGSKWLSSNTFFTGPSVVQSGGVTLPSQPVLNFSGAGVTAVNDPVAQATDVVIPGGSIGVFTPLRVLVSDALGAPASGAPLTTTATPSTVMLRDGSGGTAVANLARAYESAPGLTDARLYATGNGVTNDAAALVTASAAAPTLNYSPGTYSVASSITLGAAGRVHKPLPGATLRPTSGNNIQIAGWIDCPATQRFFDISAGGSVTFDYVINTIIEAGWFGVVGTKPGDAYIDSTAALQACIDAIAAAGGTCVLRLPKGKIRINSVTLLAIDGLTIEGAQDGSTVLVAADTGDQFTLTNCTTIRVRNVSNDVPGPSDVRTSGAYWKINGCRRVSFDYVTIHRPWKGFETALGTQAIPEPCAIMDWTHTYVVPGSSDGGGATGPATWHSVWHLHHATELRIDQVSGSMGHEATFDASGAALLIDSGIDTLHVNAFAFAQVGGSLGTDTTGGICIRAVHTNDLTTFAPRWVKIHQPAVEALNFPGIQIDDGNNIELFDTYAVTCLNAVVINGGSSLKFWGGVFGNTLEHVVKISGGKDIWFWAPVVANGNTSLGGFSGFSVAGATIENLNIWNPRIGDDTTFGTPPGPMANGIAISAPTVITEVRIVSPTFGPNVTNHIFPPALGVDIGSEFVDIGGLPTLGSDGGSARILGARGPGSGTTIAVLSGDTSVRLRVNNVDVVTATSAGLGDYTSGVVTATALKSANPNPAASGLVRGTKNETILAIRNALNNGDLPVLGGDGSDNLIVGQGANASILAGAVSARLRVNNVDVVTATSAGLGDYTSGVVTATALKSANPSPAATGLVRGTKNETILAIRNALDNADLPVFGGDGADDIIVGQAANSSILAGVATARLRAGAVDALTCIDATKLAVFDSAYTVEIDSLTAGQAVVSNSFKRLVSLSYTSANTASTLVQRDGSGNSAFVGLQISSLTASQAVATDASKNLVSLAYASVNTANALVQRDGNGDFAGRFVTATALFSTALGVWQQDDGSGNLFLGAAAGIHFNTALAEYRVRIGGADLVIVTTAAITLAAPLTLTNQTTTTSAPAAGGAGPLPALPAGYLTVTVNGVARQVPFY